MDSPRLLQIDMPEPKRRSFKGKIALAVSLPLSLVALAISGITYACVIATEREEEKIVQRYEQEQADKEKARREEQEKAERKAAEEAESKRQQLALDKAKLEREEAQKQEQLRLEEKQRVSRQERDQAEREEARRQEEERQRLADLDAQKTLEARRKADKQERDQKTIKNYVRENKLVNGKIKFDTWYDPVAAIQEKSPETKGELYRVKIKTTVISTSGGSFEEKPVIINGYFFLVNGEVIAYETSRKGWDSLKKFKLVGPTPDD